MVRLSPKAVEAGLRETLRKNFKVSNTESFDIVHFHPVIYQRPKYSVKVFGQSIWSEKFKGKHLTKKIGLKDIFKAVKASLRETL